MTRYLNFDFNFDFFSIRQNPVSSITGNLISNFSVKNPVIAKNTFTWKINYF